MPSLHFVPAAQAFPHAPQLLRSFLKFVHCPLQLLRLGVHPHAPLMHPLPPVHVTPHAPQLVSSVLRFTQVPLQLASTEATDGHLAEAQKTIGSLTEQVRQLSMELRPATLDSYGLGPALEWYLDSYRRRSGVTVELRYEGIDRRFPHAVEIAAYRLVQEALTNVARHSGARDALVQLHADGDTLTVVVRDRGLGFDGSTSRTGTGLLGMRERVALLNGKIEIDSAPGEGVTITAELPIDESRSSLVGGA